VLIEFLGLSAARGHGALGVLGPISAAVVLPGAAALCNLRRRPAVPLLAVGAAAAVVIASGLRGERNYWEIAYQGTQDPSQSLPLAREVDAVTTPSDLVVTEGLDWGPAVLYYARRRGQMLRDALPPATLDAILAKVKSSNYHTLAGYGDDPQGVLSRWSWVGVRTQHVYSMDDSPQRVRGAPLIATSDVAAFQQAAAVGLPLGPLELTCGGTGLALPQTEGAIWLRLEGDPPPGARLSADPSLATLPVRQVTIVPGGRQLSCSGTGSLRFVEAVEAPPPSQA
jgi:hypothetical protein